MKEGEINSNEEDQLDKSGKSEEGSSDRQAAAPYVGNGCTCSYVGKVSSQIWMDSSDHDLLIGDKASGHVDATAISGFAEVTRFSVM